MTNQKILNTIFKGAGIVFIGTLISKAITYLYRASVARLLDPTAYGQLSLGLAVLGLANAIALLAFPQAIQKFIPEYRSKGDKASIKGIVKSASEFSLILSLLATVLIFASAGFLSREIFNSQNPKQLKLIIQILAFVPPFGNLLDIFDSVAVAHQKVKYETITESIFRNLVQLVATLALILIGFDILGAAYGWLIGTIAGCALAFYFMEKKIGPILLDDTEADRNYRQILKFSSPLVISGIIATLLGWTDTLLLGYFMSDASVGIYNIALTTAMLLLIPHQAFGKLALPSMSEIKQKEEEELKSLLKTLTRWTFSLALPAFILIALFSKEVLLLLFGTQYTGGSTALIILGLGYIFQAFTGHMGPLVKSYSNTKLIMKNSVAQLVANIGLNLFLIPKLGTLGAAIATTTSIIIGSSLLVIETYYLHKIHPFSLNLLKPIASSLPSLIIVYLLLNNLFQAVPLWALIPGVAIFLTLHTTIFILIGGIEQSDKNIIIGIGRKLDQEEKAAKVAERVTK